MRAMPSRSAQQRIGDLGEAAFRVFCSGNGLTANKFDQDYGLDFFCQVDNAVSFMGMGTIGPTMVVASVRSSTRRDARITLDRADVELLLRSTTPALVALLDLRDADRPEVRYRFLDVSFASELLSFIESDRGTVSFTPTSFRSRGTFAADLAEAVSDGSVERTRLQIAQRRLDAALDGATVEIHRGPLGQYTLITAVDLFGSFDDADEAGREAIYLATFGCEAQRQQRIEALGLREGLINALAPLPGPYVVAGFTPVEEAELTVSGPSGSATCRFEWASNGLHWGYTHPAGFAFTFSARVRVDDNWVHVLQTLPDPDVELDLADYPDLAAFLEHCDADAVLNGGRLPTDFPATEFGGLTALGNLARGVAVAHHIEGWPGGLVSLRDAASAEIVATLAWIRFVHQAALRHQPLVELVQGDPEQLLALDATIALPAIANVHETGLVITASGRGLIYLDDGYPVAFRLQAVDACDLSVTDRFLKSTELPELVIDPDGPTFSMGSEGLRQTETDASSLDIGLAWERAS